MSAARSAVVQPAPTLEHAPSPSAGSHGTPASAGQRAANSGRSPRNGLVRGRRWGRGARHRARGPRGCPGPSAAPTGRRGRSLTPSRRSCGARQRDGAPGTPRTTPTGAPGETRPGRARGATRAAPGDRTCAAGTRPARGTPSRRPAREAPPPRRRSACPPRNRRASPDDRQARDRAACARRCSWRPRHPASARAEDRHEGVECLGRQREQPVGVDLDPAVGGRRRLVRLLAARDRARGRAGRRRAPARRTSPRPAPPGSDRPAAARHPRAHVSRGLGPVE